jgi:hypothetical protein
MCWYRPPGRRSTAHVGCWGYIGNAVLRRRLTESDPQLTTPSLVALARQGHVLAATPSHTVHLGRSKETRNHETFRLLAHCRLLGNRHRDRTGAGPAWEVGQIWRHIRRRCAGRPGSWSGATLAPEPARRCWSGNDWPVRGDIRWWRSGGPGPWPHATVSANKEEAVGLSTE